MRRGGAIGKPLDWTVIILFDERFVHGFSRRHGPAPFHLPRDQLADGGLQRSFGVAVVLPRLVLGEQGRRGLHREALRIQARTHLAPLHRHRYRSAGPHARRERRNGRRHAVIAQVVEKDATGAQLLGHVEEIAVGTVGGHGGADRLREGLGLVPAKTVLLLHRRAA